MLPRCLLSSVAVFNDNDGKRFVVRADEKLTAFLELKRVTHEWAVGRAAARLGTTDNKEGFSYEYGQFAIKNRRPVTVHRPHYN